jgi:uncharacterized membrane protein YhaH (DUF805 family)
MNNSILSLLLSPKGKISGREFLVALFLLFIVTMYWIQGMSINVINVYMMNYLGSTEHMVILQQLLGFSGSWKFIMIPVMFLLSWTPVMLGIKRGAALGFPRWLSVLCGFGLILLFRPLMAVPQIIQLKSLPRDYISALPMHGNILLIITLGAFILGLISCLVLGLLRGTEKGPLGSEIYTEEGLTRYGLIVKLGKIFLINIGVLLCLFLVILALSDGFRNMGEIRGTLKVLQYLLSVYSLVLFIYYLLLLVRRFRTSAAPGWPFILALILSLCISIAVAIIAILTRSPTLGYLSPAALDLAIFVSQGVFITALLLPEKDISRNRDKEIAASL